MFYSHEEDAELKEKFHEMELRINKFLEANCANQFHLTQEDVLGFEKPRVEVTRSISLNMGASKLSLNLKKNRVPS